MKVMEVNNQAVKMKRKRATKEVGKERRGEGKRETDGRGSEYN